MKKIIFAFAIISSFICPSTYAMDFRLIVSSIFGMGYHPKVEETKQDSQSTTINPIPSCIPASTLGCLPNEVLDIIIDKAIEEIPQTSKLKDIQNIALSCKRFAFLIQRWIAGTSQTDKVVIRKYLALLSDKGSDAWFNWEQPSNRKAAAERILAEFIQIQGVGLKACQIIIPHYLKAGAAINACNLEIVRHHSTATERDNFSTRDRLLPLACIAKNKNAVKVLLDLGATIEKSNLDMFNQLMVIANRRLPDAAEIDRLINQAYEKQQNNNNA